VQIRKNEEDLIYLKLFLFNHFVKMIKNIAVAVAVENENMKLLPSDEAAERNKILLKIT